jgi:hypothetical protein
VAKIAVGYRAYSPCLNTAGRTFVTG